MTNKVYLLGILFCVWVLTTFTLPGCGSGDILVEGRFTWNGEPLPPESSEVMCSFTNLEGEGTIDDKSFPAILSRDGSFKVPGYFKKGIPEGKYRVIFFGGKLGRTFAPGKSPLTVEINSRNARPVLELNVPASSARAGQLKTG